MKDHFNSSGMSFGVGGGSAFGSITGGAFDQLGGSSSYYNERKVYSPSTPLSNGLENDVCTCVKSPYAQTFRISGRPVSALNFSSSIKAPSTPFTLTSRTAEVGSSPLNRRLKSPRRSNLKKMKSGWCPVCSSRGRTSPKSLLREEQKSSLAISEIIKQPPLANLILKNIKSVNGGFRPNTSPFLNHGRPGTSAGESITVDSTRRMSARRASLRASRGRENISDRSKMVTLAQMRALTIAMCTMKAKMVHLVSELKAHGGGEVMENGYGESILEEGRVVHHEYNSAQRGLLSEAENLRRALDQESAAKEMEHKRGLKCKSLASRVVSKAIGSALNLRVKLEKPKINVETLKDEIKAYKAKVADAQVRVEQSENKAKELRRKCKMLSNTQNTFKAMLHETKSRFSMSERRLREYGKLERASSLRVGELKAKLVRSQTKKNELAALLREQEKKIQLKVVVREKPTNANKNDNAVILELEKLRLKVQVLEEDKRKDAEKIKSFASELFSVKNERNVCVEDMKIRCKAQKTRIDTMQEEIASLKANLEQSRRERDDALEDAEEMASHIKWLRDLASRQKSAGVAETKVAVVVASASRVQEKREHSQLLAKVRSNLADTLASQACFSGVMREELRHTLSKAHAKEMEKLKRELLAKFAKSKFTPEPLLVEEQKKDRLESKKIEATNEDENVVKNNLSRPENNSTVVPPKVSEPVKDDKDIEPTKPVDIDKDTEPTKAATKVQKFCRKCSAVSLAKEELNERARKARVQSVKVSSAGENNVCGVYIRAGLEGNISFMKSNKLGTYVIKRVALYKWILGGVSSSGESDQFEVYYENVCKNENRDRGDTPPATGWQVADSTKLKPVPVLDISLDYKEIHAYTVSGSGNSASLGLHPVFTEVGLYDGVPQYQCISADKMSMLILRRIASEELGQRIWVIARIPISEEEGAPANQIYFVNTEYGALAVPPRSKWYLGQDGTLPVPVVESLDISTAKLAGKIEDMFQFFSNKPKQIQEKFGMRLNE